MSIFFLWFLCWFIPIFSKCTSNIMMWSAKLSLHLCVTLLCVRFKGVMVQRSKHVDALLSPDAISLPHMPSSVAFFLRNSWRLKVAAWIGCTSSIYMEESTVVQLLLELWTSAFKNMTRVFLASHHFQYDFILSLFVIIPAVGYTLWSRKKKISSIWNTEMFCVTTFSHDNL